MENSELNNKPIENEKPSEYYLEGYNDFFYEREPSMKYIDNSVILQDYLDGYWDALIEIVFNKGSIDE